MQLNYFTATTFIVSLILYISISFYEANGKAINYPSPEVSLQHSVGVSRHNNNNQGQVVHFHFLPLLLYFLVWWASGIFIITT